MALSERELNIAQQVKDQWGTEEDFMDILQQIRSEQPAESEPVAEPVAPTTPVAPVATKPEVSTGDSIMNTISSGASTLSKGIGSTLTSITTGLEDVGKGVSGLAKSWLSSLGVPFKKEWEMGNLWAPVEKTLTPSQSALSIWKGSLSLWFTAAFPATTVILNTAWETESGKKVLLPVAEAIAKGGEIVNKLPGLSNFRNSLPEEERKDFDAFTAQVTTLGLAKWASNIISKFKTAKIDALNKKAVAGVEEFIKPTKETTKQITKEITPTILEKGIKGTREQVAALAEKNIEVYGKQIGDFIEQGKVKWEIPLDKLVDTLAKVDKELRFEGKILPGKEAQVAYLDKQINFLNDVQKKFGNNLPPEQQIMLKRSFDTVFDKTITRDKIAKFQDEVDVKLADTLRAELAKNNPDLAALNKEFSFYKNLDNVMQETLQRTTWQAEKWLIQTIKDAKGAGIGAGIWWYIGSTLWPVWWFAGATIGGTIGNSLETILQNPKWKLVSAVKKAELAKALAEWKLTNIEKVIKWIEKTMSVPSVGSLQDIIEAKNKELKTKLNPLSTITSK